MLTSIYTDNHILSIKIVFPTIFGPVPPGTSLLLIPQSSVLRGAYNPAKHHCKIAQRRAAGPRTTRRNTTARLPSAGPEARVQPGETPLQDCPAPGRRPAYNPAKHHCKIAQRRAGGPRTTRRNTTARLPSAGPQARVQPGETPLQDCPAPGRRPSVLTPPRAARS